MNLFTTATLLPALFSMEKIVAFGVLGGNYSTTNVVGISVNELYALTISLNSNGLFLDIWPNHST